jgi:hypothetical protein
MVTATLGVLRLPVSVGERVVRRDDDKAWPPTLAFDAFAASTRQVVGSMVGDDELVHDAQLAQERVAELRQANRLELKAERERAEADERFEQRRQTNDQQRQRTAQRAAQERRRAEERQAEKEAQVEEEARAAEARAERAEEATDDVIRKQERSAKAERLREESAALEREQQAVTAKSDVIDLDEKLEASKARTKRTTKTTNGKPKRTTKSRS